MNKRLIVLLITSMCIGMLLISCSSTKDQDAYSKQVIIIQQPEAAPSTDGSLHQPPFMENVQSPRVYYVLSKRENSIYPFENPEKITQIILGSSVSMVIMSDGGLWTWGDSFKDQLEVNAIQNRHIPVKIMDDVQSVSIGFNRVMAVRTDGTLWAWGCNLRGGFGDGTTESSQIPTLIMDDIRIVSQGVLHTSVIKKDNSLWVWGDIVQYYPLDNIFPRSPKRVMENVTYISSGSGHTMIICSEGNLWGFGINHSGQVGDGEVYGNAPWHRALPPVLVMENVSSVSAGGESTSAITYDGYLWSWGLNTGVSFMAGRNAFSRPVKIMSDVRSVSVEKFIRNDDTLWAWGSNFFGAVGDGTNISRPYPVQIMENVYMVASSGHSLARSFCGTLWAWGSNFAGELGVSEFEFDRSNIPIPIATVGIQP